MARLVLSALNASGILLSPLFGRVGLLLLIQVPIALSIFRVI